MIRDVRENIHQATKTTAAAKRADDGLLPLARSMKLSEMPSRRMDLTATTFNAARRASPNALGHATPAEESSGWAPTLPYP